MATHHYLCAGVWSHGSSDGMRYYIHHRATTQYVCADVWSNHSPDWLITYNIEVWPLPITYVLMSDQMTLLNEWLITHNTGVLPLPTMYVLMSDQSTLLTECLVTYFTGKTMLSTMYMKLFFIEFSCSIFVSGNHIGSGSSSSFILMTSSTFIPVTWFESPDDVWHVSVHKPGSWFSKSTQFMPSLRVGNVSSTLCSITTGTLVETDCNCSSHMMICMLHETMTEHEF